ncbi:MAG: dihydropteroate synthase [Lachnospiraceae bacterium]|nr:dihydropteroate synthase [Lachnospiraceae bacterium]
MRIGRREFAPGRTYVMGILNVTPDSFSDGGRYVDASSALRRTEEMIREGADIIDIGGESTRPGSVPVDVAEEMRRVLPVIGAIRKKYDVPISLDTYHAQTAEAGLDAGADLINDIHGLADPAMTRVAAQHHAAVCLMHDRDMSEASDLIREIREDLRAIRERALAAGIDKEQILLDPGVGFGKDREQNLQILARLSEFQGLGAPVLLGASRKSVIGRTLDLPENERLEGTLATTAAAVWAGCLFVRVHDVKENVRMIRMLEAIRAYGDRKQEG